MKWNTMYPASQRIINNVYPALFVFVQSFWHTKLLQDKLKYCARYLYEICLEHRYFHPLFQESWSLHPIEAIWLLVYTFVQGKSNVSYRNFSNLSCWGFHILCVKFTRSWEGHQLLAYVESHLKLSLHWNTAETELHLISTWKHNSSEVHLKFAPVWFRPWDRFAQSFVSLRKPICELSLNCRFWFRSLRFSFRSFSWSSTISGHNLKSHQTHFRPYGVKIETSMVLTHSPHIHSYTSISSADLARLL